jgi:hypothetical protein
MNCSSKISSALALSLLLFAVLACRTGRKEEFSMPADKQDYVGDWQGKLKDVSLTLRIAPDGTVNYERKEGSGSVTRSRSISNGKITKFDGNDFEVKAFLVSTTFKVEKPPYRDGNRWKMVVDGVEVSRKGANSNEVSIDIAEMRKDDGNGKMSSEVADTFTQSDKVIHRFVTLDNPKTGTAIKFVTIAVESGEARNEELNEAIVITKNDAENEIRSTLRMTGKPLPIGDYKVDIYVNDKLERTLTFKII